MENKVREIGLNSIDLNPNAEKIILEYQNQLDWIIYELAKISAVPKEYQYNNCMGSVTFKTK